MTTWAISVADTFFNELLNLPQAVQKKVSKVVKILETDPISAQGDAKKLKDYTNNVYRVRLGDYRLFYSFGQGWVKLLSIRKRDERTYEIEIPDFDAPSPPPSDSILTPQPIAGMPAPPTLTTKGGVDIGPESSSTRDQITTSLPVALTESLLQQWQIPAIHWPDVLKVSNAEGILELPISENLISRIIDNLYPRPIEEIAAQKEYILQQPEDLDRFVEGNLSAFLLKLDPEQEALRDFGKQGPVLVKGGPGTGKSTLALYRVETLLSQGYKPILFTTYTKALVAYSEQLLTQLLEQPPEDAGVKVSTVDGLVYRQYITTYGKPKFAQDYQCQNLLEEDQDLSPVSLRFLLGLVPTLAGIYLTADASQSLYQRGFSWKQIHQDLRVTGRSLLLKRNYRNTAQITAACTAILQGTDAGDAECLVQEPSPHQGEVPSVLMTDSADQIAQLVRDFFLQAAKTYRIPLHGGAVLCPSNQMGEDIAARLSNLGLKTQFFQGNQLDLNATCVKVLTLHSAKGLEFPFMAIIGLQEGRLPKLDPNLPEEESSAAIAEQRRLFYVGCSRAMRALTVIGSRSSPSLLLESLTAPSWQR